MGAAMMRLLRPALVAVIVLGGCRRENGPHPSRSGAHLDRGSISTAPAADDGQWLTAAKDAANTRYSGLHQIDRDNVKELEVAWTFSTGLVKGHEAAPLVVGDTMYVITPFPNHLVALDLGKAGAPAKWT